MMKMNIYTPPKPAPLPQDYDEFYASLSSDEKALDLLAKEKLGSSYFIQWTRMYTAWLKKQTEKRKQDEEKKEE